MGKFLYWLKEGVILFYVILYFNYRDLRYGDSDKVVESMAKDLAEDDPGLYGWTIMVLGAILALVLTVAVIFAIGIIVVTIIV